MAVNIVSYNLQTSDTAESFSMKSSGFLQSKYLSGNKIIENILLCPAVSLIILQWPKPNGFSNNICMYTVGYS